MGNPEFDLRIKVKPASRLKTKPKTKAEAAGYIKDIKTKKHQIGKNSKQGQAALKIEMLTLIKGYLCYKTITPQICCLRHSLRIFLFRRKVMFRSRDIQVFVFLAIPQFSKSVMSW